MSVQTTEVRIYNWAAWARAGGAGVALGYKSPSLSLLRDHVGGDRWNPPCVAISDEEGLAIDSAVTRLRDCDELMHSALCLHYVIGKSFRDCARALQDKGYNITHQGVSALVMRAVSWIDGYCGGINDIAA